MLSRCLMQWLSKTCVTFECADLVRSNYSCYQPIQGQFSVPKAYQAPAAPHIEASAPTKAVSDAADRQSLPTAGQKRRAEQDLAEPAPAAEAGCDSNPQPHRHSNTKKQPDPQAASRQAEAQQRHDACQPSLLSAFQLFQQFLQGRNCVNTALHLLRSAGPTAPPEQAATADNKQQQHDSLDLLALREMKYSLHPKLSFSTEGRQSVSVNLFDTVICNPSDEDLLADACGHALVIPAQAAFLLSDVKKLGPLLQGQCK